MTKVTIDTEDSKQINKLVVLLAKHGWRPTERHGARDALREFAKPKPDEPMGHAAVVEDFDGRRWVSWRVGDVGYHERPWQLVEMDQDGEPEFRDYADIDVARVLFDGS